MNIYIHIHTVDAANPPFRSSSLRVASNDRYDYTLCIVYVLRTLMYLYIYTYMYINMYMYIIYILYMYIYMYMYI
jgi:hypothetical protein